MDAYVDDGWLVVCRLLVGGVSPLLDLLFVPVQVVVVVVASASSSSSSPHIIFSSLCCVVIVLSQFMIGRWSSRLSVLKRLDS